VVTERLAIQLLGEFRVSVGARAIDQWLPLRAWGYSRGDGATSLRRAQLR
jgi:hypothetical protein